MTGGPPVIRSEARDLHSIERRKFLSRCALVGAAFLAGCASMVTHPVPVSAGRIRVTLTDYPELSRAGAAIKLQPSGMEDPIYLLANGGEFVAVSPICTHRGCTVDVHGERLVCPCHGSTYDRSGNVLKGPAQRALTRYTVARDGDTLIISL